MTATFAQQIALLGCAGLLVWAAVGDIIHFRIANRLSLAVAALFGAYATAGWLAGTPVAALSGLVAGFGVFIAGFLLYSRGLLGGGDVKLFSAVALWSGLDGLPQLVFIVALAGGVMALGMVGAKTFSYVRQPASRPAGLPMWRALLRQPAPYGVAIAAGGLVFIARLGGLA